MNPSQIQALLPQMKYIKGNPSIQENQQINQLIAKQKLTIQNLKKENNNFTGALKAEIMLAKYYRQLNKSSLALESLENAYDDFVSHQSTISDFNSNIVSQALLDLGNYSFESCQFQKAIQYYDTLKSFIQNEDSDIHNHAIIFLNKGLCYFYLNNYNQAEETLKKGLHVNEDVIGDRIKNFISGLIYQNLGCISQCRNLFELAAENFDKALKILQKFLSKETPQIIDLKFQYFISIEKIKKHSSSQIIGTISNLINEINKSLPNFPEWENRIGTYYYTLGTLYLKYHETSKAYKELKKCQQIWLKYQNDNQIDYYLSHVEELLNNLGTLKK